MPMPGVTGLEGQTHPKTRQLHFNWTTTRLAGTKDKNPILPHPNTKNERRPREGKRLKITCLPSVYCSGSLSMSHAPSPASIAALMSLLLLVSINVPVWQQRQTKTSCTRRGKSSSAANLPATGLRPALTRKEALWPTKHQHGTTETTARNIVTHEVSRRRRRWGTGPPAPERRRSRPPGRGSKPRCASSFPRPGRRPRPA